MGLIQKIKDLFRRSKVKKLNAPQENIAQNSFDETKQLNNLDYIKDSEKVVLTDEQKITETLSRIGCDDKTIRNVLKLPNIELLNFRKNWNTLSKFNYSNIELKIIITNNPEVFNITNDVLEDVIEDLIEQLKDKKAIRELIVSDSKVLKYGISDKIEKIENIFNDYGIKLKDNLDILVENSEVINMNEDYLRNSLNLIRQYANEQNTFIDLIKVEPIVIGINNTNLLAEYIG